VATPVGGPGEPDQRLGGDRGRCRLGLLPSQTWARVVAIILALLSAIANFLWLPYYPCRSLLIVAVEVFVIWAIAAQGREVGVGP
jgi:hypothetical protein